jgi:hypothetical protein
MLSQKTKFDLRKTNVLPLIYTQNNNEANEFFKVNRCCLLGIVG